MKVLITGDPDKSRTKKLIKSIEAAGHVVVLDEPDDRIRGLSIREILEDDTLGKSIKVEASRPTDRMKLVTPGKGKNRKSRRTSAAITKRQKGKEKGRYTNG